MHIGCFGCRCARAHERLSVWAHGVCLDRRVQLRESQGLWGSLCGGHRGGNCLLEPVSLPIPQNDRPVVLATIRIGCWLRKVNRVLSVRCNRCDYLDPALAWTGVKNSGRGISLSKFGVCTSLHQSFSCNTDYSVLLCLIPLLHCTSSTHSCWTCALWCYVSYCAALWTDRLWPTHTCKKCTY